jgi:hypothetical protein
MAIVNDDPGSLRVRLRDTGPGSNISGSGNDFATVRVVAEHAERAAFARTALAVKLRELDVVCAERDRLSEQARLITQECRDLAIYCERHDADLEAAINGQLRRAR